MRGFPKLEEPASLSVLSMCVDTPNVSGNADIMRCSSNFFRLLANEVNFEDDTNCGDCAYGERRYHNSIIVH